VGPLVCAVDVICGFSLRCGVDGIVQRAENILEKNPPDLGSFWCPWHRLLLGTPRMTWSTWLPQPAQVVFPHFLQFTALHILLPTVSNGSIPDYTPWGI
jgi:hypothetical protein